MKKRQVLVNAIASVLQVVFTGITFVVLYRFVIESIGIEEFGVWSLVLATTLASSIANLGLANSAVKFVSMYLAREEEVRVAQVIQTAVLTIGIFLACFLLGLYPLIEKLVTLFVESSDRLPIEKLPAVLSILPYAFISFWLSSTAAVLLSCIDGFSRIDRRSIVVSGAALLYLGLVFLLVPRSGLIGLAQAQVGQSIAMLIVSWLVLKRLFPGLPFLPYRWNWSTFKEMLVYSVNFQVISASRLLFEPLVKILVTHFGGFGAIGFFEFAHKMVFQLRSFIATAHQSIVPTIAFLQEKAPDQIQVVYKKSYQLLLYIVLPLLPFFIACTPIVSRLWIGHYESQFVVFSYLLFVGWFLNILSNPAYYANLGIGKLRWNVIGHLTMGVLNGGLGWLLGAQFGGTGVVLGFVIGLVVGSMVTAQTYQWEYGIRYSDLFRGESLRLGILSVIALTVSVALYYLLEDKWHLVFLAALIFFVFTVMLARPMWTHSVRGIVGDWISNILIQKQTD